MQNPEAPPPYPGFNPYVAPTQQYPYPGQQYPPGQPYSPSGQQQYPPGQQFTPGQQYPPGHQLPMGQYPAGPPPAGFAPYAPPPVIHIPASGQYVDESGKVDENVMSGWTGFTDKAIRAVFIRKVYSILMLQLLFTFAVVALFVFEPHTKRFVKTHAYLYYVSYVIFLGVYISLACCGNLRRQYPTNMILLTIFTMSMSYMMGTISSFYDTDVVFLAVGICAGVCLAVSVFSCHSKFDFTTCSGVLFILVWVLFLFGIITIFTHHHIMNTIYAGCGALLFVLFLAYDTQMLMGGKKHELSPEEHIFAAMQIYLDIVYIFMFLLMLLGSGKK